MRGPFVLGLALLAVAPLYAQQSTPSPHGDLTTGCGVCHSANGWTPVRIARSFDHSRLGFALDGAHGAASCRACHRTLDFKGVRSECVACHTDKHRGELGANCARCHTARSFLDREKVTGAHRLTRFPLEGGHLAVDCSACHAPGGQGSLQFVATPIECVSCHRSNYDAAPNHVAGNFPTACAGCHSQVAWNRATGMNGGHPSSPIALTGVHAGSQCTDCHLAGQPYAAVQQTCDGCHHTDFVGTREPDHVAAAFPPTCTSCHGLVAGWAGATYVHATSPIDPKQGAHGAVTCAQCHTTAPYSSVPATCDGCHHADYVTTTNPSHTAAGIGTSCGDCHQVAAGWTGATYSSHPSVPLALSGQHAIPPRVCTDCHTTPSYASVPATCDGCHHSTYVGVTDPNHTAAGMAAFAAANCSNCHSPTRADWTRPTWTHMTIVNPRPVRLPHEGASCADCHQTATNYTMTSCAKSGCHRNANGP